MTETSPAKAARWVVPLCALTALLAPVPQARAQDDDETELRVRLEPEDRNTRGTLDDRDARNRDRVPTGARRAREWRPTPGGASADAWHFSAGAGLAFFSGDDAVSDDPGFALELKASRDLTADLYVVGSYLLGFAESEFTDPVDGTEESDSHLLHVPTIGLGVRLEATPEIGFFLEPKIGALFSSDADAAPVGGATVGTDIELDPGIAVRVSFTGLVTDTELEVDDDAEADLNGIWSVGVGLVFEF